MNISLPKASQHIQLFGLLVLPIVAVGGYITAYNPVLVMGAALAAASGISALVLMQRANLLISLMLCVSLLIIMPAILPRGAEDRPDAATGGGMDVRAQAQLLLFVMIIAICCWLWLVAEAGIADLLRTPSNLLFAYAGLIAMSLLYSPTLEWPGFGLIKVVSVVMLLTLLSKAITTVGELKRLIDFVVGAITFVLGVYWVDIVTGTATYGGGRYRTAWLHSNHLSLLATIMFLILAVRFLGTPGLGGRLQIALMVFGAISALVSSSKSALGGAAFAMLIIVLLIMAKKPTATMVSRIVLLAIGVVAIIAYFFINNLGIAAHLTAYNEQVSSPTNLTGRVPIWNAAINATLATPFTTMLGHGYLSGFSIGFKGTYWSTTQAHNSFIQTFFDLGLVGLVVVVWLYVAGWVKGISAVLRFQRDDPRWIRGLELLAVLLAFTVASMTGDIMGGTIQNRSIVFLVLLFCIFQNHRVSSENAPGRAPSPRTP